MGMDGFQVVQTLRQRGVRTPIIIVSGRKEDYDTLYGLDIGADDYVTKPFNPVTLGAKVKALSAVAATACLGRTASSPPDPSPTTPAPCAFIKTGWKFSSPQRRTR